MYRDLVKGNKLCYNFEQERMRQIHLRKLEVASSKVKTQSDKPPQNQNKKFLILEEKYTEIERANRILLEKIQNIMKPEKRRTCSSYMGSSVGRKTLNSETRKKELVRITIENQQIYNRLRHKRASYDTRNILKSTQQHIQLVQQISEYSQTKRYRINSAKRQKSQDLQFMFNSELYCINRIQKLRVFNILQKFALKIICLKYLLMKMGRPQKCWKCHKKMDNQY